MKSASLDDRRLYPIFTLALGTSRRSSKKSLAHGVCRTDKRWCGQSFSTNGKLILSEIADTHYSDFLTATLPMDGNLATDRLPLIKEGLDPHTIGVSSLSLSFSLRLSLSISYYSLSPTPILIWPIGGASGIGRAVTTMLVSKGSAHSIKAWSSISLSNFCPQNQSLCGRPRPKRSRIPLQRPQ